MRAPGDKKRLTLILGTVVCLLIATPVFAQHNHGKPEAIYDRLQRPRVSYHVEAEVDPYRGTISGWLDLNYLNWTNDTLSVITLELADSPYPEQFELNCYDSVYHVVQRDSLLAGKSNYLWLDSILFKASRLSRPAKMLSGERLELYLPDPVYPGESAPLILYFETKFNDGLDSGKVGDVWERIDNWFPQVAHYIDGEWRATSQMSATDDHPLASYSLSLTIDSAFHLIAPGELVNEKEHYGTLPQPNGDTVAVDVTSFLYAFNPDNPYRPIFDGGKKRYFYRLLNGNGCDLLLANRIQMDLAQAGDVRVEVVYPKSSSESYRDRVAYEAAGAVNRLSEKLGHWPYQSVRLIALPANHKIPGSREIVWLPPELGGNSDIRATVMHLLARSWLADGIVPTPTDKRPPLFTVIDEALAVVIAQDALIGSSEQGLVGPAEMAAFSVDGWTVVTPFMLERCRTMLNELSILCGQKKFLALIKQVSERNRFLAIRREQFVQLVRQSCGENGVELFNRFDSSGNPNALEMHRMKGN